MHGPLEGIRVLDLSAVLSGPFATMILADQGAEVIKVEAPGYGDLMRLAGFARGGLSSFYANCNRGKRTIVVDVRKPRGRDLVLRMVEGTDVFVQNFRPGTVERLGLGEEDLRRVNPDLIYASVSGFGDTGPYAARRVYDPVIQGMSGNVAVQVDRDTGNRDLIRNVVCDKGSALTLAQAITAALFARERGAGGQHVRLAMLDASIALFWPDGMMGHTFVGEDVSDGRALYEMYRLTETADGHILHFAASDAEFLGLFRALGREDLVQDPRFGDMANRGEHLEELEALLAEELRKHASADLLERLVAEEVPCGPVHALEDVIRDPQVVHNELIVEREHPQAGRMRQPRPPAHFSGTPAPPGRLAPLYAEHTDEILAELGCDADEVRGLRDDDVVA